MELPPNSQVIITAGVFMDKEARIIKAGKKKVEVEITSMGYKLVAYIDRSSIAPANALYKQ